ncbi:hypothetical protein MTO96_048377 [Rhipicephalus appendiculatus]
MRGSLLDTGGSQRWGRAGCKGGSHFRRTGARLRSGGRRQRCSLRSIGKRLREVRRMRPKRERALGKRGRGTSRQRRFRNPAVPVCDGPRPPVCGCCGQGPARDEPQDSEGE